LIIVWTDCYLQGNFEAGSARLFFYVEVYMFELIVQASFYIKYHNADIANVYSINSLNVGSSKSL